MRQIYFGKYPPDLHFLLKIFSIFFFMILSSDIFLFSFKISQKLVRKIFTVHTFSVAEKVARSFTASFRGSIYFSSRSLLLLLSRLRMLLVRRRWDLRAGLARLRAHSRSSSTSRVCFITGRTWWMPLALYRSGAVLK